MTKKIEYRPEVDGLRALAVIPVILYHAGIKAFSGGFVGVDVFFVISGYLITTIILSELEQRDFSVFGFYERRARRILPALFFVILFCIFFSWLWLLPADMKEFSDSVAAISVFGSNILFLHESGYFDTIAEYKPLLHTWSLAVEEQFYVFYPLLLIALWRFGKKVIVLSIVALVVLSIGASQYFIESDPAAIFYLFPARAWELLIGSLTAMYLSSYNNIQKGRMTGEAGSFAGLLLILFPVFLYDKNTPFPGFFALAPVLGASMLTVFCNKKTIVGKILSGRLLTAIGLVSYSAYLWHWPLFAFARYRSVGEPSVMVFLSLVATTFIMAYISWRFVELPFRNKTLFSRKQIFTFASVGLSVMLTFGLSGNFADGFEDRFGKSAVLPGDVGHLEFHKYIDQKYYDGEPVGIAESSLRWEGFLRCKQSKKGAAQVVLLGDSHAEHLFIGLAEAMPDLNTVFYIRGGNPYLSNPAFHDIYKELSENKADQLVLLAMHYYGAHVRRDELYHEFGRIIDKLKAANKRVVLVGDVPCYLVDPSKCKYGTVNQKSCDLSVAEAESQRDVYLSTLVRLSKEKSVAYIDLYPAIYGQNKYSMVKDGAVLYRDCNHLNILGSRLVGRYLARHLPM